MKTHDYPQRQCPKCGAWVWLVNYPSHKCAPARTVNAGDAAESDPLVPGTYRAMPTNRE